MTALILASASKTRVDMLRNAGLTFTAVPSSVDERAVEKPLLEAGFSANDLAVVLAEAKALEVSERHTEALVIGCDQTLGLDGERLIKPESMEEARRQLLKLRGRIHALHAAVVCVKGGEVLWRHDDTARLTMRDFTPEFIGRYLAQVGEAALSSVGCYQLEGAGVQLFDRVDGDYFTVLGLPLLPLLGFLREDGALET